MLLAQVFLLGSSCGIDGSKDATLRKIHFQQESLEERRTNRAALRWEKSKVQRTPPTPSNHIKTLEIYTL